MTDFQNIFDTKISGNGLVLAVSGGADSMTMLSLAHRFARCPLTVVTVNHHIRKKAYLDAALVRDYCKANGIPFTEAHIYPAEFARENKISLETAARILRYDALDLLAQGKTICLAHTKNDQAETVLMHLVRGSGGRGARGMKKVSGNYYRPLLGLTRAEVIEYVERNNIPFAEDPTNKNNAYDRNYMRNIVIPRLSKLNPNAVDNISRYAESKSADEDYFEEQLSRIYPSLGINISETGAEIPQKAFELHPALTSRVLLMVFCSLGYGKDIEKAHIDAVCGLSEKPTGKRINLPFGVLAVKNYGAVELLHSREEPPEQEGFSHTLPFGEGRHLFCGGALLVTAEKTGGLRFDGGKIPFGAVIRAPGSGDVFTKFGGGAKPLRRYLTDKKIPLPKRKTLPVVACGNEVLLIFGVEISEKIKVDENTKQILYAKIVKN